MKNFHRVVSSLVSFAMLAAPFTRAQAQTQSELNTACISYAALPAGVGISVKFPDEQEWRSLQNSSQQVVLTSAVGSKADVLIWKRLPRSDADRTASNTAQFTIELTPTANPKTCRGGASNYRVLANADEYTLVGTSAPKPEGPSAAAVAVGAIVVVGLLAALFGGSSSKSSSNASSRDAARNAEDAAANARYQREAEARAAAEREAQRRSAEAAWERLQRPNSLGW